MRYLLLLLILISLAWIDPYYDAIKKGNSSYKDQKYPDADAEYKKALEYVPSEKEKPYVAFNRGDASFKAGDYESALGYYQKALESEETELQKRAFFNMGNTFKEQGKIDEAVDSYLNALKIDPGYEKAIKNLEALTKEQEQQKQKDKQKQQKDKEGDQDQKDKNQQDDQNKKDENKQQQKQNNDEKDKKVPEKIEKKLSKEQIQNLLKQFQKKPLNRKKGDEDGVRILEKGW